MDISAGCRTAGRSCWLVGLAAVFVVQEHGDDFTTNVPGGGAADSQHVDELELATQDVDNTQRAIDSLVGDTAAGVHHHGVTGEAQDGAAAVANCPAGGR